MKKIVLIFSLITSLVSEVHSWDTASSRFMPLAVGNKWIYNVVTGSPGYTSNSISRIIVVSDTVISSKRFFKISGSPFSGSDSGYAFVRYDSSSGKLIKYMNSGFCNNIYTYAKLSSVYWDTTGNCFAIENFTCNNVYDTVLFNLSTVYKSFYYNESGHIDRSTWIAFAKNIGMVLFSVSSASGSGYSYRTQSLKGFVINGIVYGDTSTLVIGIQPISSETPNQFSLSQNYPNPFNPKTKIEFRISKLGFVTLQVFDALGREVATIVNEQLTAGTYEADWNADNFSSGVYYYKLSAGDFSETKKMVLMK